MGDQDDKMEELKGLIAGKQGELVRLAEVEGEEETTLRSRGTATAAATPQEAGTPGAGQQEAAWYQGKRGPHPQARPHRQVGGQDLVAIIRRELGEQTTEIRKSIDELRSFQGCRQDAMRREEVTTQGPRILGSREELELRVEDAAKKVYVWSETLAKKEEERAGGEEHAKEHIKRANSGGRVLVPKQNHRGAPEVALLKA